MKTFFNIILVLTTPGLALAHEGHHVEGLLGHTLHGFSVVEIMCAVGAVSVWILTHKREDKTKSLGTIAAACLLALGFAI